MDFGHFIFICNSELNTDVIYSGWLVMHGIGTGGGCGGITGKKKTQPTLVVKTRVGTMATPQKYLQNQTATATSTGDNVCRLLADLRAALDVTVTVQPCTSNPVRASANPHSVQCRPCLMNEVNGHLSKGTMCHFHHGQIKRE